MKRQIPIGLTICVALAACGGPDATPATTLTSQDLAGGPFDAAPGALDRATAEARAIGFFGGTVISSKLDTERGLSVFEIDVLLPSGAVLEVKLEEATGRVVKIESKVGPLTDDLDFGPNFLTLAEAIAAARAAHDGTVVEWELEVDDGIRWVFEIEFADDVQLKIDAQNGAIVDSSHTDDLWDSRRDDGQHAEAPANIVQQATTIVAGDIIKSEREMEHGMNVWKISIGAANGATVEVYLLADDGGLLRVRDDNGPFDYRVMPGRGWMSLAEALTAAGGSTDTLARFRLDREGSVFVYEFRFDNGGDHEDVRIDAVSGNVI